MKYTCFSIVFLFCGITELVAQESVNASGAELSGNNGTISYSIGQVVYQTMEMPNVSFSEGVEQPYEIYVIDGIEVEEIAINFAAYPNPTTDILNLNVGDYDRKGLSFQLFDLAGKLILSESIIAKNTAIDLSRFAMSTYYLTILTDQKTIKTFKIIKT